MFRFSGFTGAFVLTMFAVAGQMAADDVDPWAQTDLMPAAELNRQVSAVKAGKIILLQVGFVVLYKQGHIPGSQYAGPGSKAEGLVALEKLVGKLPRRQEIVIYCGCCPWEECPNIRPAYQALKQLGFSNVKVLNLPTRLGADWVAKGYPRTRGE